MWLAIERAYPASYRTLFKFFKLFLLSVLQFFWTLLRVEYTACLDTHAFYVNLTFGHFMLIYRLGQGSPIIHLQRLPYRFMEGQGQYEARLSSWAPQSRHMRKFQRHSIVTPK